MSRVLAALCIVLVACVAMARPARALDVAPWQRVLDAHTRRGGFDYAGLRADPPRRADLDVFLAGVAAMPESEPLYAWLDAYNALVVKAVVARPGLRSVRDVPGFFDRVQHRVAGRARTLDQLENEVIRRRFPDARVHAALNCGARSCPALSPRAFTAANVDGELTRLARAMVASDAHVRVRDGALSVSAIFTWYAGDFRRDAGSVRAWIARYDATGRLRALPANAPVRELGYDWALNAAPPR